MVDQGPPREEIIEHKIFSCENTKLLNQTEKQWLGVPEELIEGEWNVCDNQDCKEICNDYFKTKMTSRSIYNLRGDNPSCLCIIY